MVRRDGIESVVQSEDPRPEFLAEIFAFVLCGLTVDPCVYVAFAPSQVLSDSVGWQSPFSPFVADGALWDGEDRGDFAG
jgi:hypothetical protein